MKRAGGRRRCHPNAGASRRGRVLPTLEDLRGALLAEHPECARAQAGGRGRMLAIAQVVCDWTTPEAARVLEECTTAEGLARNVARREARARPPSKLAQEMAWEDMRRRSIDAAKGLAARFEADARVAEERALCSRRSAA